MSVNEIRITPAWLAGMQPIKESAATQPPKHDPATSSKISTARRGDSDRVDLSAQARARAADEQQSKSRTETINAPLTLPPLNTHQAKSILKRIEQGVYAQPAVIAQYASRLARDLIISEIRTHSFIA